MTTQLQQSPYLPRQRNFPRDQVDELSQELDKTYIDISARVNERMIGMFSLNLPSITGEAWYFKGNQKKQQTLRQIYQFTSFANIAHGINFTNFQGFTRIYGTFTDGTLWYPLPYVDNASAASQVKISVNSTNILFSAGGTAPTITSGTIVLEWLTVPQNNAP